MHIHFHVRGPFTKQLALLKALEAAADNSGDVLSSEHGFVEARDCDAVVLFGIGGWARAARDAYHGKPIIFFDKGYSRGGFFRVAVNCFQPLAYFQNTPRPSDRFEALGIKPRHYGADGGYILFDGASNKFCIWQGLGDWREWGAETMAALKATTDRTVVYRPRPSHNIPDPLPALSEALAGARVVVSYGGNIGWDCAVAGVPHFALGDSIARPISETRWGNLDVPFIPAEAERLQWFYDVAYCQWTLDEISEGRAWQEIRKPLL